MEIIFFSTIGKAIKNVGLLKDIILRFRRRRLIKLPCKVRGICEHI